MILKIQNKLRNFDKYRKSKMIGLEKLLYKLINNSKYNQDTLLAKTKVKKILIIRNNKRIGNMYFLIPFVRQIRDKFPNAEITLMLNMEWQGAVFENIGIDHFCYTDLSVKHFFKTLSVINKQKKTVYDLIFVPNSSAGDSAICAMLSGQNKISSYHKLRTIPFTHLYSKTDNLYHMALSSLFLLDETGYGITQPIRHNMIFSQKEAEHWDTFFQQRRRYDSLIIAYYRGARGDKLLPVEYWQNLIAKFDAAVAKKIKWIEVLSPDVTRPLAIHIETVEQKNIRLLASFLKKVDCFICCDTGPLHLADAAGAKCIGLYNKTSPNIFGVIGQQTINIENIDDFDIVETLHAIGTLEKKNPEESSITVAK